MTGKGVLLGFITYLSILCAVLVISTFCAVPEKITPLIPWIVLGLAPIAVPFGQLIISKNERLKKSLISAFFGYLIWTAILALLQLGDVGIHSIRGTWTILIGYSVIATAILAGRQF